MLASLLARLRAWLRPAALQRDIDAEIREHLARERDDLLRAGLTDVAAEVEARRRFGNVTLDRERSREAYGWMWPGQVLQDARYAARALVRTPMFTFAAVASLALAIGANATIFSAIHALLLNPLPVVNPDELVTIEQAGRGDDRSPNLAFADYDRFQQLTAFRGAAAVTWSDAFNVEASGAATGLDPRQLRVSVVTGNYFDVLGIGPQRGRLLSASDDVTVGAHPVVVIADNYWTRRFARSDRAIGSTLKILDTTYTVIGIVPSTFHGEWIGWPTDLWIPVAMAGEVFGTPTTAAPVPRGGRWQYKVIARLAPDASVESAQAAGRVLRDRILQEQLPGSGLMKDWSLVVAPAATGYASQRKEFRQPLLLLMGIVGALLFIACANVASLLLARGAAREGELAIRAAIGASRWRLIRQLLTESLILSGAGGLAGIGLAFIGTASIGAIAASGPVSSVQWGTSSVTLDMTPDIAVIGFTAMACALATLLFGLVPALRAVSRAADRSVLGRIRSTRATAEGVRLRSGLVVVQVAISMMLLCTAVLFVRSIHNLRSEPLGFDRARLALAWILPGYGVSDNDVMLRRISTATQRVSEIGGITSVSASVNGIFSGSAGTSPRMRLEGQSDADAIFADDGRFVGPGFFATMGQRLIAGREFTDADGPSASKVLIVDDSFARRMFGSADAVGQRLLVGGASAVPYEIVGVVANAKYSAPRAASWSTVYLPLAQARGLRRACLIIRTDQPADQVAMNIRRQLAAVDPQLPILDIDTVDQQLDRVLFRERLVERLATAFALIAFMLACLGLYGVTSFLANRRSREIGIRLALGARPASILRLVAAQSLCLVVIGVGLGLLGTVAARELLTKQLYGISGSDPMTIVAAAVAFLAAGLAASCLPAARAARSQPVRALRAD